MTFYIDQQILIFWVLVFGVVAFIGGWIVKISIDQYKADQEREERASERRQAYEQNKDYIKQLNRNNLFNSWVAEAKGGVKK